MSRDWRKYVAALCVALPWPVKRLVYSMVLGYDVSDSAYVGFSLVLADRVTLASGARIGHLNSIRGLTELSLGSNAIIRNGNWITAYPMSTGPHYANEPDRLPGLHVGAEAAITSLHVLDCTNLISIGRASTIGGWRSQILTHAIDLGRSRQRSSPVTIGEFCFVGTGSTLLSGSSLPAHSVLAANGCLSERFLDEYWLYAGVPARPIKKLDPEDRYFTRDQGYVI